MLKIKQKGISLVSAMVASGIVAALGLSVAKISQQSVQISKNTKNTMDLNTEFNLINNKLLKQNVCKNTLLNLEVGENIPDSKMANIGLKIDKKIAGTSLITKRVKFIKKDDSYYIQARFEKDSRDKSYGPKQLTKNFPISVVMNGGRVAECHSDVGNAIDNAVSIAEKNVCKEMMKGEMVTEVVADLSSSIRVRGRRGRSCKRIECPQSHPMGSSNCINRGFSKIRKCYKGKTITTCQNSSVRKKLCELEEFMMKTEGSGGTTTCGDTFEVKTVNINTDKDRKHSFPERIIGNKVFIALLGGGGGGNFGGKKGAGKGGAAGKVLSGEVEVPNRECQLIIGKGGAPDTNGGNTILKCGKKLIGMARGGKGKRGRQGNRCGDRGESVDFLGKTYKGSGGHCREGKGHGGDAEYGAGGGGGAKGRNISKWRKRSRKGGDGRGYISYKYLKKVNSGRSIGSI